MLTQAGKSDRKRIALACNGCRIKRTKCDGQQPQCGACRYREEECRYNQGDSKRRRASNSYILALETQVAQLKERLLIMETSVSQKLRPKPVADNSGESEHHQSTMRHRDTSVIPEIPKPQSFDEDDLVNALGCFTLGDTGELRYFGASSNFNIVQNSSLRVASSSEARALGLAAVQQLPDYRMPSGEPQDHLLELFWRWQNSWQVLVHRESFLADLYVTKCGRYCTPLLVSAVMALASRYSDRAEFRTRPEDPNTAGELFATQAKTMLHFEYEAPTTSTVQAAALLGLYWAAIDRESLGFMYIGMASRMAMNLGLHSDCSIYVEQSIISEADAEVRNTAFWGVYVLDKLYCLGMGRPAGIQENNITTKRPKINISTPLSLPTGLKAICQPFPTQHINSNANQMCEIFFITSAVIDQLYAQRPTWMSTERDDQIMQTHLSLLEWFEKLPTDLRISNSSLQPSEPYVYQLHLQYHVSMILLHRPFFAILNPGQGTREYHSTGDDIHSQSCRAAAAKISEILRIFDKNFGSRYLPISSVHPAFTAGIFHLLHLKQVGPEMGKEALRRLHTCIKALYGMNTQWDWANRSSRAILSLAVQWKVDICVPALQSMIDPENLRRYEEYEKACLMMHTARTEDEEGMLQQNPSCGFDIQFDFWDFDQSLMNTGLDIFDSFI